MGKLQTYQRLSYAMMILGVLVLLSTIVYEKSKSSPLSNTEDHVLRKMNKYAAISILGGITIFILLGAAELKEID